MTVSSVTITASPAATAVADSELLHAFASRRDEAAFRCLTERYAGLVHGIAARRLGNPHAAQEVTSEVFILLARKACKLTRPGSLAAWLQRTAALTAANAVRRENRRHAAMNAYAAALETASPAGDPVWREAVPHLDEALARLGERDRELIMARYFNGLSHGEIARERGSTAEAVKKAGQRALDKLCGLLRKRGVVIPAVALASGLASHVRAAAPPGIAQQVAATAAAATGGGQAGLFHALHHSLVYMTYGKPLTSVSLLILFCAALGGGSWLTAYSLASAGNVPMLWESRKTGTLSSHSPVMAAPGSSPHHVREILRQAVKLIRQSTMSGDQDANRAMDRALVLLTTLSVGEMKAAARAADEYRGEPEVAYRLATALAAAWSEADPEAALAWVEKFPAPARTPAERGMGNIVNAWFASDGPSAWKWWMRRSQATPPPPSDWDVFIGTGLSHWARHDPAAATLAAGQAAGGSERIIRSLAMEWSRLQIEADSPAMDAAMQWSNASLRAELARGLSLNRGMQGESSDIYLSRLFPVLNRLCGDDPESMEGAVAPLVREWAGTGPEKAVSWIFRETAGTAANTRHLLRPALQEWAAKDSAEAWNWLDQTAASDPAQSARLYSAILEPASTAPPDAGTAAGAVELPAVWANQIAAATTKSQDRLLRFWAQRQLELRAVDGGTPETTLAEWQAAIQKAEASSGTAATALAWRALELARRSAIPGPEKETPVTSSPK